jgi:hypothetical protein
VSASFALAGTEKINRNEKARAVNFISIPNQVRAIISWSLDVS